jgi:plasminogen activator
LRSRSWFSISSDNALDDYDWLLGYSGFESWSDWSHHDDTRLAKAFEIDLGASARFVEAGPISLSVLAGYRFHTQKWNAYGGSFIYSTNGFQDDIGSFPQGELQISYQQWWHAPYLGLGVTYISGPLSISLEAIGSPLVSVRDRDNHVDIGFFKEAFSPTTMIGGSLSAELALNQRFSLMAGAEAERLFKARGGIKEFDVDPPEFSRFPKPAAGADHESVLVSFGAKARF